MQQEPDLQSVMQTVMTDIVRDRALSFPWYQSWIRTEAEAEAAYDRLPLVYSWNEITSGNQLRFFTVSVNGNLMGKLLEQHLPRTHPAFGPTRDTLVTLLATVQNRALRDVCIETRCTPSQISAQLKN
jgi:hypothetical protein